VYAYGGFGYIELMNSKEAIAVLVAHREDLRARGVLHAALFGSVARGEARSDSDLDIMIELDPDARIDAFEYAGLKMFIEGLFSGPVDVVNRHALKSYLRPFVATDAVYAF
jgi:predicted nucleotidyltransferase